MLKFPIKIVTFVAEEWNFWRKKQKISCKYEFAMVQVEPEKFK